MAYFGYPIPGTSSNFSTTAKDDRCPYCGRPVIGKSIQGLEGRYHPACTQPADSGRVPYVPVQPWTPPFWVPLDNPYRWDITCGVAPLTVGI